ncbi:MAG: AmmeMemoRadiSam system protein B [Candidatus Magasanikbacteria bacterium]|nr:AmmeMemoRadiSam system protein B [Candidatus Magasanikbacteria bacterium]
MSLVFAAITPHSPALIPNIGKDKLDVIKKTKEAMEKLEAELYVTKPNVIITISPHGSFFKDAFTVNAHTHFMSSFEEFGDVATKKEWYGIPELAALVSRAQMHTKTPARLVSQEKLDHGATIPLHYLTKHLPNVKILPIGYSEFSTKEHINFGSALKEVISHQSLRIAVIASGDLSHSLTHDSPVKFNEKGKEFDNILIELLETRNTLGISNFSEELIKGASECGYRSILILLGILKNKNFHFKNLSYEHPFGVGYLVGKFDF